MKTFSKIPAVLILLLVFLVPAGTVRAQGPNPEGGQVLFGRNYTLESGDTFEGDLVVFGGSVSIEEDATLNGNLVVIGGTIESRGETLGDMIAVGGQIDLKSTAVVGGDVVTVGGQLLQAEGVSIGGEIISNAAPDITLPPARIPPAEPSVPVVPDVSRPHFQFHFSPFTEVFWILFWAVILAAFAMLISLFWQPQIERTGALIVAQPLMTGAIGLLAFFVAALLALTIVPPLVVAFAWLFGVVAMGAQVGERFSRAVNQVWSPVLTTGFGTFLLMLVGGALGLIPCLGGVALFFLGLLGTGSSLITWFGIRLPEIQVMRPGGSADPAAGHGPPAG